MYILEELINKARKELIENGLSEDSVYTGYCKVWNQLIDVYDKDAVFDEEMVHRHCMNYFKRNIFEIDSAKLLRNEKKYIRAFKRLIQVSKDIPCIEHSPHFIRDYILSERSKTLLDGYLDRCKNNGNGASTIDVKEKAIKRFIINSDFDNVSTETALEYIKARKNSLNYVSYRNDMMFIFPFLFYCYEKGEISKEILALWPKNFSGTSDKKIPSAFTLDEIGTLLKESKDYNKENFHLRNYAVLSLIVYTGIRCSDVCNLTFNDIDWINNVITIVQQKNKKQVVFPLIPEIGNPIIEYIKNERPRTDDNHVFVTGKGSKMNSHSISDIIKTYFSASSIDIGERHHSAHALRHSLATNMINNSVPVFTIANTLGHSDLSSVHIYAKVNIEGLRKCVLEVPSA